jgi:esterase/lipase
MLNTKDEEFVEQVRTSAPCNFGDDYETIKRLLEVINRQTKEHCKHTGQLVDEYKTIIDSFRAEVKELEEQNVKIWNTLSSIAECGHEDCEWCLAHAVMAEQALKERV